MKCGEIIELLEEKYPTALAEPWDNPGLQAGRREKEVRKVYIALDATDETVEHACRLGIDLLLTHHPLLMHPLKLVNADTFLGKRVVELLRHDICYYALHTNYDLVTMAPLSSEMLRLKDAEILELTRDDTVTGRAEGFGRVGSLPAEMTLGACGEYVKQVFGLDSVKIFGDLQRPVLRAAVSPGSGKSMIGPALKQKAEVLVSGDIGHHEGIDAIAQGLCIIDAGHYGLEHIFIRQMAQELKEACPDLEVYEEAISNPFQVI